VVETYLRPGRAPARPRLGRTGQTRRLRPGPQQGSRPERDQSRSQAIEAVGRAEALRGQLAEADRPGDRSLFKGGSPHSRPQASRAKSSPMCSRVLPLRHGARSHTSRKLTRNGRSQTAARGACNRLAVTSTPPSSPKPGVERANRHAGGVQLHHGSAPLRPRRIQH
jgi:hypothetical protein